MASDFVGKPLTGRGSSDFLEIGDWWARRSQDGRKPLRMRPGYIVPGPPHAATEGLRHAPAKELVRRRGIAFRLHLVALYHEQLTSHSERQWDASPVTGLRPWQDERVGGQLSVPSWASLTLGYERPPPGDRERRAWQRSRYEAVTNGFDRLADLELLDPATRTLNLEDRPWRRRSQFGPRTYHALGRREPYFTIPAVLFTSGSYLELSGVALHTLLVLCYLRQPRPKTSVVSRFGLTQSSFDFGRAELNTSTRLPASLRP